MRKSPLLFMLFASAVVLQGCAHKQEQNTANTARSGASQQLTALQICLNEAKTLVGINKQYQKEVNNLYAAIDNTKFYNSISGSINPDISQTITPLYEYIVRDKCNTISQHLMGELKSRVEDKRFLKSE